MLTCEKCNMQFDDNTKFCVSCGSPLNAVSDDINCPACGEKNKKESVFCQKCGKALKETANVAAPAPTPVKKDNVFSGLISSLSAFIGNLPKQTVIVVCAVLLLVAVAVIALIFTSGSKEKLSIAYLKDSEINFTYTDKIKPFEVTGDLVEDKADANDSDDAEALSYVIMYSKDGKYMYYPDKADGDSASLYCRNLRADNTKTDSAIKIDSEVNFSSLSYLISEDGTKAVYLKGSDNTLYCYAHNLKDKFKIDDKVKLFFIAKDGSSVVYEKEDGIYKADIPALKNKEKIDSDAKIESVSTDLKWIYYSKEDSLYLKEGNKEKQKIASDFESLTAMYDKGVLYYIKSADSEAVLSDFVNDDLAASDALIKEPNMNDYISPENTDIYSDEWFDYYDALDEYDAKLARDELRQQLATEKTTFKSKTLCFYDGSKEITVSDSLSNIISVADKKPVAVYTKTDKTEVTKVKFSEIYSIGDVKSLIETGGSSSPEVYIAVKGTETLVEQTKGISFLINPTASKLLFIDDFSAENKYGALTEININENGIGKPSKIDDEVGLYQFKNKSDSVIYFKNVKEKKGDLFENKKSIATDVYIISVYSIANSPSLAFITDYSSSADTGTLKFYNGSKTNKIADDVFSFMAQKDKNIAYITNYSKDKRRGDAFLYNGSNKAVKIDTDVTGFIPDMAKIGYYNNYYE